MVRTFLCLQSAANVTLITFDIFTPLSNKCYKMPIYVYCKYDSLVGKKRLSLTAVGDLEVVFFLPLDVERRDNPVCHFVTPLDGSMDLDIHRPADVRQKNVMIM